MRKVGRLALKSLDNWNSLSDFIRVDLEIAIFKQIGNERMQAVNRNELFREIEGGAEMIYTAVGVFRICNVISIYFAAEAEDPRSRCKYGIPLRRF